MYQPLIALTPGLQENEDFLVLHRTYMEQLVRAGCMPVMLPLISDEAQLSRLADRFDGFVFTGGGDIEGHWFGTETHPNAGLIAPQRDSMEIPLARLLYASGKPVLGICRGAQVLAVALGGSLWQDLPSEYPDYAVAHRQKLPQRYPSHEIIVSENTMLYGILGTAHTRVNSIHHQAVRGLPDTLRASAYSADGVLEAFEAPDKRFFMGIQWHPERLADGGTASDRIFDAFAEACGTEK